MDDRSSLDFAGQVLGYLDDVGQLLIAKNKAYGNSALEPLRVFSRGSATEQLLVRIDDKLSRIARGSNMGEDTITDLIGYLVILKIAEEKEDDQCQQSTK